MFSFLKTKDVEFRVKYVESTGGSNVNAMILGRISLIAYMLTLEYNCLRKQ